MESEKNFSIGLMMAQIHPNTLKRVFNDKNP